MIRSLYSNTTAAVMIIVAVTVIGIIKFTQLPIALYPLTTKPELNVRVNTGSTNANEFKERYGEDIETALLAINDAEKVLGNYQNGSARYTVEFDWGTDPDQAKQDAKAALSGIASQFPREWGEPWYYYPGGNSGRVIATLKSASHPPAELEKLLDRSLMPSLERIEGMEQAWLWRIHKKHVLITPNPDRLNYQGLDFATLKKELAAREFNRSLGNLDLKAGGQFQVRAELKNQTIEDLENTVVGFRGQRAVLLKDVATVALEDVKVESISKGSGERKVLVGGNPKPDANLRQFADDFVETLEKKVKEIDPTIEVGILINPATFINEAISNVLVSVLMGVVIATLIVFLFLRSFRNTVVVTICIPFSLVAGFILMNIMGIGVNLISLGAMALAVGMVVDGAVVVLENIIRHFEEKKPETYNERLDVIVAATNEVRNAVIASLLTTIIVFAPLPFTSPLANAILGDLAIVMVSVLCVSIAVTLLVIPALVLLFRVGTQERPKAGGVYFLSSMFNVGFEHMTLLYTRTLALLFRNPALRLSFIALIVAAIGVSGWVMATQLERKVMGTPDTDKLFLWIEYKEQYDINVADKLTTEFELDMLKTFKDDVAYTFSEVNQDSAFVLGVLKDKSQVKRLKKEFEDHFKNTPELSVYVGTWTPTSLRIPNPPVVEVLVSGHNEEARRATLEKIADSLGKLDDVGRKNVEPRTNKTDYLTVTMNPRRVERLRLSRDPATAAFQESNIYELIAGYLSDTKVMEMEVGGETVDVDMRFPEQSIMSPGEVENLLIRVGDKVLPIKTFAAVRHVRDYSNFTTEDSRPLTRLQVWPKESYEGDRAELKAKVMDAIRNTKEVDQTALSFVDTEIEIDDNIRSLVIAFIIALTLICIVITVQFGSLISTGIIMLAIPLGFIGVAFSLWAFSSPLDVNSMLGLILLCGTAVNNSILYLDFFNQIRDDDSITLTDALLQTARVRFRPIMITTLTTILGMLPIAVGYGSGSEILQPLGIAVCGGLGISTLLTLLVVPFALMSVERLKKRAHSAFAIKRAAALLLAVIAGGSLIAPRTARAATGSLTLEQAEQLAFAASPSLKISRAKREQVEYDYREQWGKLLPTLSVERVIEQKNFSGGDYPTRDQAYNLFKVEESLVRPFLWFTEKRILDNRREIADSAVEAAQLAVQQSVRSQYFRANVAQTSLANAEQNLSLAEKNLELVKKRYRGGFIHESEVKRAEFQFQQVQASVEERRETLRSEKTKLLALLGLPESEALTLATDVPAEFDYFKLGEADIRGMFEGAEPKTIEQLKLQVDNAELDIKGARSRFLPDLSLSVQYADARPDPSEPPMSGTAYLINLKWTLFDGGSTYYGYLDRIKERSVVDEQLTEARRSYGVEVSSHLNQLGTLKKRYEIETKNLELLREIRDATRERFNQGLVNAELVNEDFSKYLTQQNVVLGLGLDIITTIADLTQLTARPELFEKLL